MLRNSLLASVNGALAGVAGKFAFDGRLSGGWVARGGWVVAVLALNALLVRFVALGFGEATSTVQVTGIVSAGNFIATGLLGWLVFGETLTAAWAAGAALMALGIWLMSADGATVRRGAPQR